METKNEKFRRLSKPRVNKVLDDYRLLTNLIASQYESSQAERREILEALRNGFNEVEACFAGDKADKAKFKFKDEPEED